MLHTLLLSVIYEVVQNEESIVEVLNILYQDKLDLFTCLNIRTQIEVCIFVNSNLRQNYRLRRKLNKSLVLRLENMLKVELPYRPINIRNSNRMVIVTNYLLSDLHAPTNIVKEICYILQSKLNMEVYLIVAVEDMDNSNLEQIWLNPTRMNYCEEYNGNFTFDRYNENINGYQIIMNQNNLSEIKDLVQDVYNYNPVFVWYLGNLTLFADLFKKYTTVLAIANVNIKPTFLY